MIHGSCLCGGVQFEIERAVGPFELCHCGRCRRTSGSAFMAAVGVATKDFRLLQGRELIVSYEAPILESPPAYRVFFCSRCGSPVPEPEPSSPWFEIPAGLLQDDPGLRPERHIYVDFGAAWNELRDGLPRLTKQDVADFRRNRSRRARPTSD